MIGYRWMLLFVFAALVGCTSEPASPPAESEAVLPSGAVEATTLFVVRHAEKADDGTSDPPLTEAGAARAERLATMLRDAGVAAVYATPYRRTQATAAPLAEAAGVPVTTYEVQGAALADTLLARHAGEAVLVAGHSNTVPILLNALVDDERYAQLDESEYDALFVVVAHARGAAEVVQLRFER